MKKQFIMLLFMAFVMCLATSCGNIIKNITATHGDGIRYITPTPTLPPESEGIYTSLKECDDDKIRFLITNYYSALSNGETELLKSCLSDPSLYSEANYTTLVNVNRIKIKKIFLKEGQAPLDYVAYVFTEMYVNGIDTPVPSLEELFLTASGSNWYIESGAVSADVYNEVVSSINSDKEVTRLVNSVNLLFEKALKEDPALKEYADAQKLN
ncbi:MAG: hypothetical protein K5848_06940 [Lachnospiraceae bacterium]|nr:hypothetical protein [Lachnospiraceae bacterium]